MNWLWWSMIVVGALAFLVAVALFFTLKPAQTDTAPASLMSVDTSNWEGPNTPWSPHAVFGAVAEMTEVLPQVVTVELSQLDQQDMDTDRWDSYWRELDNLLEANRHAITATWDKRWPDWNMRQLIHDIDKEEIERAMNARREAIIGSDTMSFMRGELDDLLAVK
jgi:hypothetical protein